MIAMNAETQTRGRFYRDADRAVLGGVCAGVAGYLGFNLKMTRFLAFIAFLMAMPFAIIGYLAIVFLVPSASSRTYDVATEKRFGRRRRSRKEKARKARARKDAEYVEAETPSVATVINHRCQSLDERLARLEKHVTSKRFQIDQELSRL
jgi:phage shock protein C